MQVAHNVSARIWVADVFVDVVVDLIRSPNNSLQSQRTNLRTQTSINEFDKLVFSGGTTPTSGL